MKKQLLQWLPTKAMGMGLSAMKTTTKLLSTEHKHYWSKYNVMETVGECIMPMKQCSKNIWYDVSGRLA